MQPQGLHVQDRSVKRLLDYPSSSYRTELAKIQMEGQTYHFLLWPFGLGPVQRWFTKLMKPVIAFLRRLGTRNIIYMDDLWGGDSDQEVSALNTYLNVTLLEFLGFVVSTKKSILSPTQILDDCLGFIVNSQEMSLLLPQKKITNIQNPCRDLLRQKQVSVRAVAKELWKLVATSKAVFPAPFYCRQL